MGCTCQSGSKPYDFFLLHLIVGSLLLVLFLNPCGRTLCSVLLLAQSVTIHLSLFLPAEGSQPLRWVNFRTFRFQFCSLSVHIKQPACASFLPGFLAREWWLAAWVRNAACSSVGGQKPSWKSSAFCYSSLFCCRKGCHHNFDKLTMASSFPFWHCSSYF